MVRCQLSAPPPITPIARTLRYLRLGKNNITYIPTDYFTACDLLDTVDLGGNQFSSVPDVRILNATLKILLLYDNVITHVESLYFVPMVSLKTLDLARNLLTEIQFNDAVWPSISYIFLENNLLTSIKPSELRMVRGTVMITVGGNPWHCDAKLCWLSRCVSKMGRIERYWSKCDGFKRIKLIGDIICNSPDVAIRNTGEKSYAITAEKLVFNIQLWRVAMRWGRST